MFDANVCNGIMSGEFCTSSGRVSQVGLLRCVYRRSHGLHTHARTCARARARAHTHTCLAIHTQSSNYFPARLPGKTSKWQLEVYQLGLQSMATTRTAAGCPLPPARSPCCLSSSPSKSNSEIFGKACSSIGASMVFKGRSGLGEDKKHAREHWNPLGIAQNCSKMSQEAPKTAQEQPRAFWGG